MAIFDGSFEENLKGQRQVRSDHSYCFNESEIDLGLIGRDFPCLPVPPSFEDGNAWRLEIRKSRRCRYSPQPPNREPLGEIVFILYMLRGQPKEVLIRCCCSFEPPNRKPLEQITRMCC